MCTYYDTEWGRPVCDTRGVYEALVLEGFQVGVSWDLVLHRREALRAAFDGFDPEIVATYSDLDVARLLSDRSIIRNRRKIAAAIQNARATMELAAEGRDLAEVVWSHRPDDPDAPPDRSPSESPESRALAQRLRDDGFTLIGPVTMYALMESIGVMDHRGVNAPPVDPAAATEGPR